MGLLKGSDETNNEKMKGKLISHNLETKILKYLVEITIFIIHNKTLLASEKLVAFDYQLFENLQDKDILQRVGSILRKSV